MSPSLPIDLDRSSGQPLYRQIERWIRQAIDGGRLPPGTRLPGVRTLARDLGVSVVPVITAYEQLGADGYLVSQVGLGTTVAPDPPRPIRRIDACRAPGGRRRPAAGRGAAGPTPPAAPPIAGSRMGRRAGPARANHRPTRARRRLARSWSRHLHRARLLTDAATPSPPRDGRRPGPRLAALDAGGPGRPEPGATCRAPTSSSSRPGSRRPSPPWRGPGSGRAARGAVAGDYPAAARAALAATGARRPSTSTSADEGRRLGPPTRAASTSSSSRRRSPRPDGTTIALAGPSPAGRVGDPGRGGRPRGRPRARGPRPSRCRRSPRSTWTAGSSASAASRPRSPRARPSATSSCRRRSTARSRPWSSPVARPPAGSSRRPWRLMLESGDFDRDLRRLRDARPAASVGTSDARPRPMGRLGGWSSPAGLRLRNRP